MKLLPSFTGQPETNRIYHTDALTLLGAMADNSVDMILCDLPYGTTACSWDEIIPIDAMWAEFRRIIKPRGAVVLTATEPFASRLRIAALDLFKYDWVWSKSRVSDYIRAKLKPLNNHEMVLIFSNGTVANCSDRLMNYYPQNTISVNVTHYRPSINTGTVVGRRPSHVNEWQRIVENYPRSVLHFPNPNNDTFHPTQKPQALFEYLVSTYTKEGDLVFDPCVGSGTTAVAAHNTGRNYICGDFTLEYVEIARKRVNPVFGDPPKRKREVLPLSDLPIFEALEAQS